MKTIPAFEKTNYQQYTQKGAEGLKKGAKDNKDQAITKSLQSQINI